MKSNRRKLSALIKKTLIKLSNRNLIKNYTIVSNTNFWITFNGNDQKRINQLKQICAALPYFTGYSTRAEIKNEYTYEDGNKAVTLILDLGGVYVYNDIIKLNFKRLWHKK